VTNLPLNVGADSGGRGYFGTVSGGFDYQFNDKIVAGVLANYDFADIKGNMDTTAYEAFFNPIGGQSRLKDSWAVGARIGWLVTPQTLTYFNGGYTQARFDGMSLTDLALGLVPFAGPAFVGARTYDGWFLGSGIESKLNFLPGNGWFAPSTVMPTMDLKPRRLRRPVADHLS
jgi:outer membrane immunogenic protein